MNLTHADLLWLRLNARPFLPEFDGVLALGPAAAHLPDQWQQAVAQPLQPVSICFGLPLLTEPYTLVLNSLYTERNTQIRTLSAYGWIDENAIYEPRAELVGITSIGTQPVTFLRDLDLDLPPVAYVQSSQNPNTFIRLNEVLIVQPEHIGPPLVLEGQAAALAERLSVPIVGPRIGRDTPAPAAAIGRSRTSCTKASPPGAIVSSPSNTMRAPMSAAA